MAVSQSADGWTITASNALGAPLELTTRKFEARYDPEWKPVELTLDASLRGQLLRLRTTFSGTSALNEYTQGTNTGKKNDPVSINTIILPQSVFAAYEALALRLPTVKPGAKLAVYVAPHGELDMRVDQAADERIVTPARTIGARRYQLTLMDPGNLLQVEVWADDRGRLLRVLMPAAGIEAVREDVASVAARQENVSRPGDEAVNIPAAGFNLAATVAKPATPLAEKQRWPAVVLVPGSGPQDRDETVVGIPIFGQIAGALADAGFVVVRYDKRGVGQSGGRPEAATLDDYAEDLRAAVKYLEKRKDVDPKRIAVVGHSEGGWVALIAAARDKDIASLVLIAAPATIGAELILEQQKRELDRMGLSEAEKNVKIALQKRIQQAVVSGSGWDDLKEFRKLADTAWFRSFLAFDPARIMRDVRQPMLIVQGELDRQVPLYHADRLAGLARARKKGGLVEVVKVPGVNHLLVPAKTGEVIEYAQLEDKTVSPAVASASVAWLEKTMAGRK